MSKTPKRLLIEKKQLELQVANLRNKKFQFEIKLLELEEEMDRIREQGRLQDEAVQACEDKLAELETPLEE